MKPIKLNKHLILTDIAKLDDYIIVRVHCEACSNEWDMDTDGGYTPVGEDFTLTRCEFCGE